MHLETKEMTTVWVHKPMNFNYEPDVGQYFVYYLTIVCPHFNNDKAVWHFGSFDINANPTRISNSSSPISNNPLVSCIGETELIVLALFA